MNFFRIVRTGTVAALLILGSACSSAPESSSSTSGNAAGASSADGGGLPSFSAEASTVVATVGDRQITMGELEESAKSQLLRLRMQEYDALKRSLDSMVDDSLVASAAEAAGMTPEEFRRQEVDSKIEQPGDDAIQAFYDENSARIGRPLDQVRRQIVQVLTRQGRAEAEQGFIGGLRETAGVSISLPPMRMEVATGDNAPKGTAGAPITIVEFSDFECPYCTRVVPTIEQIIEEYGDQVAIYFRHFPLPMHPNAPKAGEAANCAGEQDQFWAMHDKLFENQRALTVDNLKTYAADLGLDTEAFNTCLDSGRYTEAVQADKEAGAAVGVSGTPGFFVNGRFLNGARPFEDFKAIIDEELAG